MFFQDNILSTVKNFLLPTAVKQSQLLIRLLVFLIAINAAHLLMVGVTLERLPDILILHSNIYFGPDFSGAWWQILTAPLLGAIISLTHYLLAAILYGSRQALAFLLLGSAVIVNLFLFLATLFILGLNI